MNTFTVSFWGHRRVDNPLTLEKNLEKLISHILLNHTYVEFLVGRDGEFDQLTASVVRRCKRTIREDNSALIWVMPYVKAEFTSNEASLRNYYDEIEVCERSAKTHFKAAYRIRNQTLVRRSDLVVFYVNHDRGGAYQTMRFAMRERKPMVNLGHWGI